ncbi:hypothetical protein OPT61_g8827 [Boeremia exigua]|uniref:Uncharacterized protein n=1 Tax=Boeremia exigua TaxID=749465 RepID=A0ACC2HYA8_9PLEO|nr:hypothetical protein OPT61_g8827 [Boeremia exigua]
MAPGTDLTAQSPAAGPRIPKLKYRNPLPPDQISLSSQISAQEAIPLQRQASAASSDVPSSPYRPSFETTASTTSSSLASAPSSHSSSNDSKAAKKKKKSNSVFGFLSLKEPSQVALEQFAEQQRKQGSGKGTTSPSNSSVKTGATIASKRLPDSVPKVNSKWDGVPDAVKKRQSTASAARSSKDMKRSSGSSFGKGSQLAALPWNTSEFSVMSNESRGPPNSIISMSRRINADIYHNEHYIPSSPSEGSLPDPSYYSPEEPMASGALPVKLPASLSETEAESLSKSPYSPTHQRTISGGSHGLGSASPASSTDSVDTIVRAEAEVIFKKMNDRPQQQSFWEANAPAVQTPSESDSSVPESHDFLFEIPSSASSQKTDSPMASPPAPYVAPAAQYAEPSTHYTPSNAYDSSPPISHYTPSRPVMNFSRPMALAAPTAPKPMGFFQPAPPPPVAPSSLRSRAMSSGLPTLYENSIASTESLATIRDESDAQSVAPSVAPSSIASSELSEQWHQSSRDRLGLGGQMRKDEVLPWNTMEDTLACDSQQPA